MLIILSSLVIQRIPEKIDCDRAFLGNRQELIPINAGPLNVRSSWQDIWRKSDTLEYTSSSYGFERAPKSFFGASEDIVTKPTSSELQLPLKLQLAIFNRPDLPCFFKVIDKYVQDPITGKMTAQAENRAVIGDEAIVLKLYENTRQGRDPHSDPELLHQRSEAFTNWSNSIVNPVGSLSEFRAGLIIHVDDGLMTGYETAKETIVKRYLERFGITRVELTEEGFALRGKTYRLVRSTNSKSSDSNGKTSETLNSRNNDSSTNSVTSASTPFQIATSFADKRRNLEYLELDLNFRDKQEAVAQKTLDAMSEQQLKEKKDEIVSVLKRKKKYAARPSDSHEPRGELSPADLKQFKLKSKLVSLGYIAKQDPLLYSDFMLLSRSSGVQYGIETELNSLILRARQNDGEFLYTRPPSAFSASSSSQGSRIPIQHSESSRPLRCERG